MIRYDNRDTGHSTTYALGHPTYTLDDLVDDTMRVLDGYGLPAAHLVGMSMGGMIAQLATLQYPARVRSLTAISTTPVGRDNADLPGSDPALNAQSADAAVVDWTARAAVIAHMVEESRLLSGTGRPFDLARTTALIERDYDRARNFANATNHTLLHGGERWQGRLNELRGPLLVIHGTADPIFPIAHGVALAGAVAGGTLVRLEGGGHELHEDDWETIIAAIIEHTGAVKVSESAV